MPAVECEPQTLETALYYARSDVIRERKERLFDARPPNVVPVSRVVKPRPRKPAKRPDAMWSERAYRLWRKGVGAGKSTSLEQIMLECCRKYGVSTLEFRSHRRPNRIALARIEYGYRAKNETSRSLPEIGRFAGGFDHTTVIYWIWRFESPEHQAKVATHLAKLRGA